MENEAESEGSVAARHRTATPGVRRRGLARARRSTMLRNGYDYVKAYIPLFLAFVVLFTAVWAYISFGPHSPSAKDHWTEIETKWKPTIDADRQKVSLAVNDFTAQQAAYKTLRTDMRSWMNDLTAVADWGDARASASVNAAANSAVIRIISDGTSLGEDLDAVTSAASVQEALSFVSTMTADDSAFWIDYAAARDAIFGSPATSSNQPTLALPSGSLSPSGSPGASEIPGASGSPAAGSSASAPPSVSPSPSASPAPSASAT
ncbi:MAG TPA: hypothetical protein VJ258_01095 [Candidatus Limnocylindrales bacterium]|nr:hypothetical protein [Candidatus Limnocylindrales bacterium]